MHERLSLTRSGKVLYKLKRRYRDGSTHVVQNPMTLIERVAALVPRPRVHLTTYHGVFALCEHCGGTRTLLTFLPEPRVVRSGDPSRACT